METELLAARFGTGDLLREKRAGMLDVAGRVAAATLLLKLLDSQRRPRHEVDHAVANVNRTIARLEQAEAPSRGPIPEADFRRGPRLFVPSEGMMEGDPELRQMRYQMGFIPNVPLGMDHGMVRLASDQEAEKNAFLRATIRGIAGYARQGYQEAGAAGGRFGARIRHAFNNANAFGTAGASVPDALYNHYQTARAAGASLPGAVSGAMRQTEQQLNRVHAANPPTPPVAPAPAAPTPAVPAPAAPTTKTPTSSSGGLGIVPAALAVGAGALVAGGLPKLTSKVLDYGEKEPVTPWGMQPYGAVRINHHLNEYGQPLPLSRNNMAPIKGSGILQLTSGSHLAKARTKNNGFGGEVSFLRTQLSRQFLHAAAIMIEEFTNAPAADTDAFLLAKATSTAIQTHSTMDGVAAAGLSIPRNVTVTTTGVDGSFTFPMAVEITGMFQGRAQTETITVESGDSPGTKAGTKPFDKVTQVVIPANVDALGTVAVGFGVSIGLQRKPISRAGLAAPVREISGGSAVTTGTLTVAQLYTPAAAPDASRDYAVFYEADVSDISGLAARHRREELPLREAQRLHTPSVRLAPHSLLLRARVAHASHLTPLVEVEPGQSGVSSGVG